MTGEQKKELLNTVLKNEPAFVTKKIFYMKMNAIICLSLQLIIYIR
jgi:hypothetical protein